MSKPMAGYRRVMGDDLDDRTSLEADAAPRRRLRAPPPLWAIALMVIAGAVVVAIVGGAIIVIHALVGPFLAPNVDLAVWHAQTMPCVTWARATTEGGSFDVPPSAVIQVGLGPECSAAEIDATYASLYNDIAWVRDGDSLRIEYLVQKKAPEKPARANELARSAVAQLTMEKDYDQPSPTAFARTVRDWLTVRALIDPGAQITVLDDNAARTEERFVANSTARRLQTVSSSLPKRLREQAWKLTIPAQGDRPFTSEGRAPAGGVTIETSTGFPEPWLVDLGVRLNGAWPSTGTPEYVYIVRDPRLNELSARVFHVARADDDNSQLSPAQDTTAWPALKAAVDAMANASRSKNGDFAIGFALLARSFTTQDDYSPWSNSIRRDNSLAIVGPRQCTQPRDTAPDDGAIGSALCGYLSQRATTADGGDGGN